jgi:hypothetical protein
MLFAASTSMSKQNNRNPNHYDSTRNHPGEGVVNEEEKEKFQKLKEPRGREGDSNFIPGEKPVGEKSGQ